jgi:hypothetical protein
MKLTYAFEEDGYTVHGERIPDIPIVNLAIRIEKCRARGPAIVDTGFDGGLYPNMEITKMFKGKRPTTTIEFENPLYGRSEFEVYVAEVSYYQGERYVRIGDERIYIPKEPNLISNEVIVGREILNKLKTISLEPQSKTLNINL